MPRQYSCHTCGDPMKISLHLEIYLQAHGPQKQVCPMCGAVHQISMSETTLLVPGERYAKLTPWYSFPTFQPFRPGAYRLRFKGGGIAHNYWNWTGEKFECGPMQLSDNSVDAWQGLAGDMEHLKRMPYNMDDPINIRSTDE